MRNWSTGRRATTHRLRATATGCLAAALMGAGCGSSANRPDTLTALADATIVPAYIDLAAATDALLADVVSLCSAPDQRGLDQARASLASARSAWAFTEAIWVGPVMDRRSWAVLDWPIDREEIDTLIIEGPLDPEALATRIGADQRGLGAVEYVLHGGRESGTPPSDEDVLDTLDDGRCAYLSGITVVLADEAALLPDDWTLAHEDGPAYVKTFATDEENGLDAVVNDSLFLLEAVADAELGTALGAMEGPADVDALGEGEGGYAVADIEAHLAGLRALYLGGPTNDGLSPLLGSDLTERLTEQFDAAQAAVAALGSPLAEAIIDDPASVGDARDAIKAIQTTVATEVVARLGVTIGFSDADGDSG